MSTLKLVKNDSVILVTFGRWSESRFMLSSDFKAWLQTIDPSERACVMVTETNFDPSDLDFMQRSNRIIDRLEGEIREQRELVATRIKQKRRA